MRALILAPFSESQLGRVRSVGDVVHESWLDTGRLWDPEDLGARIAREAFDVLLVEADFVFGEVFDAAPELRLVGVCRNALNQVDLESATAHGVPVVNAPGRNTNAVAEMTVALMLALARDLPRAHAVVSGGGWRDPTLGYRRLRGREVAGAAVGVIGFGQIGREVARKCAALGARVVVYDPYVAARDVEALQGRAIDLDALAASSDFVSVHVPDAEETRGLVGRDFMALMKPDAYLINTGAGPAIDPEALVEALQAGRIAGAALDVFDGHPLPLSSALLTAPNLILTPHIGGATAETIERHSRIMADEIERLMEGLPLQHVVNPEYGSHVPPNINARRADRPG